MELNIQDSVDYLEENLEIRIPRSTAGYRNKER
jgi:hypothetical protein